MKGRFAQRSVPSTSVDHASPLQHVGAALTERWGHDQQPEQDDEEKAAEKAHTVLDDARSHADARPRRPTLVVVAANAVFGLWWADPLAAFVVAFAAARSGVRTWRGEGCAEPC